MADTDADTDTGTRLDSLILRRKYDPKTQEQKESPIASLKSNHRANSLSKQQRQELEYALVIRQIYDKDGKRERTLLNVNSPFILGAFRDVIKSHHTVATSFNEPVELESPFHMLVHHWDDLDAHRRKTTDYDVRAHLNLLFDFMEFELGPDYQRLQAMRKQGQITYDMLWAILKPDTLLITFQNGQPWLCRCVSTAYEVYSSTGPICLVDCQYTDFDGKTYGSATMEIDIRQKRSFNGLHPAAINTLPVFPLAFWNDNDEEREKLEEKLRIRGEAYKKVVAGINYKYCYGPAKYLQEPPSSYYDSSLEESSGYWIGFTESARVVMDRVLFDEEVWSKRVRITKDPEADVTLCPPFVKGFSAAKKAFCLYDIDSLTPVEWQTSPWDALLLPDAQKRILRALVENHIFPDDPRNETLQKGKGLVVLLHGSPGSGKTMTAETAAEASHRLLISSSFGELNRDNNASRFEQRLRQLLHYATRWQAIVLLDEADVFLEKREDAAGGSTERNALVAVFLKHLEYFSGIVFLTTNRVRSFDTAMKSRIHLALSYEPPDAETCRKLWMKYIKAIPEAEGTVEVNEGIDELLSTPLNGREISYAVNTARTLARQEKQPLGIEHLKTVLQVRQEFDRCLEEAATLDQGSSIVNTS